MFRYKFFKKTKKSDMKFTQEMYVWNQFEGYNTMEEVMKFDSLVNRIQTCGKKLFTKNNYKKYLVDTYNYDEEMLDEIKNDNLGDLYGQEFMGFLQQRAECIVKYIKNEAALMRICCCIQDSKNYEINQLDKYIKNK